MNSILKRPKPIRIQSVFLSIIVLQVLTSQMAVAGSDRLVQVMNERAARITQLKNDYVTKILDNYHIFYQCSQEGAIVQIMVGKQWHSVERMEIVPEITQEKKGRQTITHNIYFHAPTGILHLASDIAIIK